MSESNAQPSAGTGILIYLGVGFLNYFALLYKKLQFRRRNLNTNSYECHYQETGPLFSFIHCLIVNLLYSYAFAGGPGWCAIVLIILLFVNLIFNVVLYCKDLDICFDQQLFFTCCEEHYYHYI